MVEITVYFYDEMQTLVYRYDKRLNDGEKRVNYVDK